MRKYRIQYQKIAMTAPVLAEELVTSTLDEGDFVAAILANGHWIDSKTWLAPGCFQQVIVVA